MSRDKWFEKFEPNVLTAAAIQELIVLRQRVKDLEEYKVQSSLAITELEQKMNKVYFAPGMPGYTAAKRSYDKHFSNVSG